MKTILVPIDFSVNANNALHYAAELAKQTRGTLILVHTEAVQVAAAVNSVAIKPQEDLIAFYESKLEKLARQVKLDYGFWFHTEVICQVGTLTYELNTIIRRKKVDLVVMGTKGATTLWQKIVGTNTASYIKEAICPVLIIPENVPYKPIRKIAYASDFETTETIYLKQALYFAKPIGATVSVINIKSDRQLNTIVDDQILYEIQKEFPEPSFSIAQVKENDVVKGLQEFVEDNEMNLLAVAIQERNILEGLFHKSITRQLAFKRDLPLLALPARPYGLPKIVKQTSKSLLVMPDLP